jgi:hypothetical protein
VIIHRHFYWCNFNIPVFRVTSDRKHSDINDYSEVYGFDIKNTAIKDKRKALRNMVDPDIGLHILNCVIGHQQPMNLGLFEEEGASALDGAVAGAIASQVISVSSPVNNSPSFNGAQNSPQSLSVKTDVPKTASSAIAPNVNTNIICPMVMQGSKAGSVFFASASGTHEPSIVAICVAYQLGQYDVVEQMTCDANPSYRKNNPNCKR